MDIWDAELGRIAVPAVVRRAISLPGRATRRVSEGEFGIFLARQHRPVRDEWTGRVRRMELVWHSITHNDRVNVGGEQLDYRLLGRTPGQTNNGVFTVIAVASASFTKTATDKSLGSASQGVTTNEFTSGGLARAAGTLGTFTAQSALNGQMSQVVQNTFTSTATQTAYGAALFDSTTVAGSNLFCEDLFSSSANLLNGDTLTVQVTVSN